MVRKSFHATVEEFDNVRHPLRSKMAQPGVYVFSMNGKCLYVGKSVNSIASRVSTHIRFNGYYAAEMAHYLNQQHPLTDAIDKFRAEGTTVDIEFIPCLAQDARLYEKQLICELRPVYNINIPIECGKNKEQVQ